MTHQQQRGGLASFAIALLALSVSGGCGIFSEKKTVLGPYFDSRDTMAEIEADELDYDNATKRFKAKKVRATLGMNASNPTRAQGDADRQRIDGFNQGLAVGLNAAGQMMGLAMFRPQAAQSPYQIPTPNGPISFGGSAGISTPPPGWVYVGVPEPMQPLPPTSQPNR